MVTAIFLLTVQVLNDLDQALKSAADRSPDHRIHSLETLRCSKDRRAQQALVHLLDDDHPRVRLRTLRAIRDSADPLAILGTAVHHPSARVREGACDALGELHLPGTLPLLLDRLGDGDARVRGQAAASLGRQDDPAVCARLVEVFKRDSDGILRTSALDSVARLAPESLGEILEPAIRDSNPHVRLAAAETGRPEALAKLVSDRDWRVRAAAIDACRRRRERDSIGWLVDQLPHETGRLRWDIVAALQALTGKSLGLEPGPWTRWWDANRERFAPPAPGAPSAPAPGETQAAFFKVPILSTRIFILLDLSGSMREPSPEGGTKLDVAKKGTIETIRSLPAGARFGIAGLGCDADGAYVDRERKSWQGRPRLLPASAASKADAERFVRGLEAKGWTNLYDGIEHAFSDPDVDTVFLHTDGGASKGTYVASAEILSALARMNRFRRIVIHTVEVPGEKNAPAHRRLLQAIAESTGGTCTLYAKEMK
jgi:HEAT repeat protein